MCAQCKHEDAGRCSGLRLKVIFASDERWIEVCAENTKSPVVAHRALMLAVSCFAIGSSSISALSPEDFP